MTSTPAQFIPSEQQLAFFDWISQGQGSAILEAKAGSGKTKSLVEGSKRVPKTKTGAVFMFNRNIADEMKSKLAEAGSTHFEAKTFHSAGYSTLNRKFGKGRARVDDKKVMKLIDQEYEPEKAAKYASFVARLVSFAKGAGVGCIIADEPSVWFDMIDHHDMMLDAEDAHEAEAVDMARLILRVSNRVAERSALIDFDDQIYLPILWNLRFWQFDWVFIDEAQDTSAIRRAIARRCLKPGGRLVAVGDPNQAIYGFAGASNDALDQIRDEFKCKVLPLSVSYRCSRAVIDMARTIVPTIDPAPWAAEGAVRHVTNLKIEELGDHDAILCRATAPLVTMAYSLIARGRGCKILGKEIGEGLIALIRKLRAKDIETLQARLEAWSQREYAAAMDRKNESKANGVLDRAHCIQVCIDNLDEETRTVSNLIAKIQGLFSDTNGTLTLATGHKSKGREWQKVFVIRPDKMPSPWARQPWAVQQETNLQYVIYTRAIDELIIVNNDKEATIIQTEEAK